MKKLIVVLMALLFVVGISAVSFAVITGSVHDFSQTLPVATGGQICVPCHAPHNVAIPVTPPLWNHDESTQQYEMYSSPTFDAAPLPPPAQPTGSTKLCLSCHDGTVAIDSFGGLTGSSFIIGDANLGTNLTNDHPISFLYDTALADTDGGLFDPSEIVTIGSGAFTKTGTINDVLLQDGQLQCAACHDVHNDFVQELVPADQGKLLKISISESQLCLTCHNK